MSGKRKKAGNCTFTIPAQKREDSSGIFSVSHKVVINMSQRISTFKLKFGVKRKLFIFLRGYLRNDDTVRFLMNASKHVDTKLKNPMA